MLKRICTAVLHTELHVPADEGDGPHAQEWDFPPVRQDGHGKGMGGTQWKHKIACKAWAWVALPCGGWQLCAYVLPMCCLARAHAHARHT